MLLISTPQTFTIGHVRFQQNLISFTVGHLAVQHVPLCLCSLLAATNQFSVVIGQKMQVTGWENANNMRYAWTL